VLDFQKENGCVRDLREKRKMIEGNLGFEIKGFAK